MKELIHDAVLPNVFIALHCDGGGCNIFYRIGDGYTSPFLYDRDEEKHDIVDQDWFCDADYCWFIPLPDNFQYWGREKDAPTFS